MDKNVLLLFAALGFIIFFVSLIEAVQTSKSPAVFWTPPNYAWVWIGGIFSVVCLIAYFCVSKL